MTAPIEVLGCEARLAVLASKPVTCLCARTNRADCPCHGTSEVARKARAEEQRAAREATRRLRAIQRTCARAGAV